MKTQLQAHDGQNSEKPIHDTARPEIVDPGASCGLFFHSHKTTPRELPLLNPVWSEWWNLFGSQPVKVCDLWRLRGFEKYRRDELSSESQNGFLKRCLRKTMELGEPVLLHDGTAAVLVDMGGDFRLRRVYSGERNSFQPQRRVSFSPDKFIYRSEYAL